MWCAGNGSGAEHLLAVRSRIFVGLEEGDGETADKGGGKTGIAGHCKEALQERKAGSLQRKEQAHPLLFLLSEQGKPVVKLFAGNEEALTDPFHGSRAQEILRQDAEDEEKAVGGIRDDEVREDGMGMAAGTGKAQDAETVPDRPAAYEINQGAVIVGMDGAGPLHPAAWACLEFRPETVHEGIKKIF